MAVDLGERRIGLAVSDELRMTVRPLAVIERRGDRKDAAAIRERVQECWPG